LLDDIETVRRFLEWNVIYCDELKTICHSNASFGMKISSLSSLKKDGCNWEGIAQHDQVQMVQQLREA